ncbi:MAG: TRAM domain-containing protein [Myxococcota bacterium]|nr:TRAM domain-containing protein [Myxococcota bacterium]
MAAPRGLGIYSAIYKVIFNLPSERGHLINVFRNSLDVGDEFHCVVDRLALGGDSIASAPDGRIVFFRGAAPGDRVCLRVTQLKKRFIRAVLVSREAGDAAQDPICNLHDQCGGCPWQVVQPAVQREALEAQLNRMLKRTSATPVLCQPIRTFEPLVHWRSSTRLHWRDGVVGYFKSQSDKLVDIPSCPMLAPPLPAMLTAVRTVLGRHLAGQGTMRMTARNGGASGTVAFTQTAGPKIRLSAFETLLEQPVIHGITVDQAQRLRSFGAPVDHLGQWSIPHAAGCFVQGHQRGNHGLVDYVLESCQGYESILEFYAGSGNFTIPLAEAGHRVRFVEIDQQAVDTLDQALQHRQVHGRVSGQCEPANRVPSGTWDLVLLDPPRSGARQLCEQLATVTARRLVYVSCHPPSFARDAHILNSGRWRLKRVEPFELFPHTGHVETVALFECDTEFGGSHR